MASIMPRQSVMDYAGHTGETNPSYYYDLPGQQFRRRISCRAVMTYDHQSRNCGIIRLVSSIVFLRLYGPPGAMPE